MKSFLIKTGNRNSIPMFKYYSNEEKMDALDSMGELNLHAFSDKYKFKHLPKYYKNEKFNFSLFIPNMTESSLFFFPNNWHINEFHLLNVKSGLYVLQLPNDFTFNKIKIQFFDRLELFIQSNIPRTIYVDENYLGKVIFTPNIKIIKEY